jgi:hypothetical protein
MRKISRAERTLILVRLVHFDNNVTLQCCVLGVPVCSGSVSVRPRRQTDRLIMLSASKWDNKVKKRGPSQKQLPLIPSMISIKGSLSWQKAGNQAERSRPSTTGMEWQYQTCGYVRSRGCTILDKTVQDMLTFLIKVWFGAATL